MISKEREINHTLNYAKALACFCVLMLHCGFPGVVGKLLYGPCRFAVPFFFMISGYFVYGQYKEKQDYVHLNRKVKHIALLLLWTELIYFVWHIAYANITAGVAGIKLWFSETFTLVNLARFIFLQKTAIGDVSWFLVSLLLCYLFTHIIARKNIWEQLTHLIPILLLINILIGEIWAIFFCPLNWWAISNVWLLGFPFYALGYWVKMNETALLAKVTTRKTAIAISLSVIIVTAERVGTSASQFFIGNILCATSLFLLALKQPQAMGGGGMRIVETIGTKCAFYVYILHPIFRDIYRLVFNSLGLSENIAIQWLAPIIVFAACVGTALLIDKLHHIPHAQNVH